MGIRRRRRSRLNASSTTVFVVTATLLAAMACGGSTPENPNVDPESLNDAQADTKEDVVEDAAVDDDGGGDGLAIDIPFPKTDSATAGRCSESEARKIVCCASAGEANVTEIDPASGAVTQITIPNVSVNAAHRDATGATLIVGYSSINPLAALIQPNNSVAWAFTFGSGLQRAVDLAARDASNYLVAYAGRVLQLPASGTGATSVAFDAPASTVIRKLAPLPGGGWAILAEIERTFPEQDLLVIAMASNGTIAWQKLFANGGRNLASSITALADGGVVVTGVSRPAGPSVPMDGWATRLGSNGAVTWQRVYGTGGQVKFTFATAGTGGGIRLGGTSQGFAVFDTGADGSVTSATRYTYSTNLSLGGTVLPSGELVLTGADTSNHHYQLLKTNADLTTGCGASFGESVSVSSVPAMHVVTDTTFVASSSPVTGTPITLTPSAPQVVTPVNKCGG